MEIGSVLLENEEMRFGLLWLCDKAWTASPRFQAKQNRFPQFFLPYALYNIILH